MVKSIETPMEPSSLQQVSIFLRYLLLYLPLVPIALFGTFDFLGLLEKFVEERNYLKMNEKAGQTTFRVERIPIQKEIAIQDPNIISNLGTINHVFLDKTGTLSKMNYKIGVLSTTEKIYEIQNHISAIERHQTQIMKYGVGESGKPLEKKMSGSIQPEPGPTKSPEPGEGSQFLQSIGKGKSEERKDESELIKMRQSVSVVPGEKGLDELNFEDMPESAPDEQAMVQIPAFQSKKMNLKILEEAQSDAKKKQENKKETGKEEQKEPKEQKRENTEESKGVPKEERRMVPEAIRLSYLNTSGVQEVPNLPNEQDLYKDAQGKTSKPLNELLKCLALCHYAKKNFNVVQDRYILETNRKEDEAFLQAAEDLNVTYEFSPNFPNKYCVSFGNEKKEFDIFGVNQYTEKRKRFSIVVGQKGEFPTIYVRGDVEGMNTVLDMDQKDKEDFDGLINFLSEKNLKVKIFGKRVLTDEEGEKFKKNIRSLKGSLLDQQEELELLAEEVESHIKLVGVVGLADEMVDGAQDLINLLHKDLNCKIWIVSGDSQQNVINIAKQVELINTNEKFQTFTIKAEKLEELTVEVREILTDIKNVVAIKADFDEKEQIGRNVTLGKMVSLSEEKKMEFANTLLSLNGKSLDIIMNDSFLLPHFLLIASLVPKMISYNISPVNKANLVNLVKDYFPGKPCILGVGDGLNDALMLQSAHVGIQIVHPKLYKIKEEKGPELSKDLKEEIKKGPEYSYRWKANDEVNFGDIQIGSITQLKDLLLVLGKVNFERKESLLFLMIYKSILLGLGLFFYNCLTSFRGAPLINDLQVFLYDFWFSSLSIIFFGLLYNPFSATLLKQVPGFLLDCRMKLNTYFRRFCVRPGLEGLAHALLIFFETYYMVGSSTTENGKNSDFFMLAQLYLFSILLMIQMKV